MTTNSFLDQSDDFFVIHTLQNHLIFSLSLSLLFLSGFFFYLCAVKDEIMKRTIAIVLLCVAALIAVQPTLAFHYCSGGLSSVRLFSDRTDVCCCGGHEAEELTANHLPDAPCELALPVESCCSNRVLTLSTDDFQTTQALASGVHPGWALPVFFVSQLISLKTPDASSILPFNFPPGGLAKSGTDVLALNCILRI
jgi:hypothetical protein